MKNSSPLRGKPSTGEPDAGDPHVRFGGRGDVNQCVVPTPIVKRLHRKSFKNCYHLEISHWMAFLTHGSVGLTGSAVSTSTGYRAPWPSNFRIIFLAMLCEISGSFPKTLAFSNGSASRS